MTSAYVCGIMHYDLNRSGNDRPFSRLYARCKCGQSWEAHGVHGLEKCPRYEPEMK